MATLEIDELLASKTNITPQTVKNYKRIYTKLRDELNEDIKATSEKNLIKLVLQVSNDNPSVALTYLNIPIMIKRYFKKDVDLLVKKQVELNKARGEHTKGLIQEKKEELPTYETLKNYLKSLLKNNDHQGYIINYLLMTYGFRNKDLDLLITTKELTPNIEIENNLIIIKKTECEVIINDYKTLQSYGQKRFVIKSKHFKDACEKIGVGNYLLNHNGEHIKESSLASYIKNRTYNNIGEGSYFKVLINHIQLTSKTPLQDIKKLSLSRGTNFENIAEHYNIAVSK
jgi:hypothetical protein